MVALVTLITHVQGSWVAWKCLSPFLVSLLCLPCEVHYTRALWLMHSEARQLKTSFPESKDLLLLCEGKKGFVCTGM